MHDRIWTVENGIHRSDDGYSIHESPRNRDVWIIIPPPGKADIPSVSIGGVEAAKVRIAEVDEAQNGREDFPNTVVARRGGNKDNTIPVYCVYFLHPKSHSLQCRQASSLRKAKTAIKDLKEAGAFVGTLKTYVAGWL